MPTLQLLITFLLIDLMMSHIASYKKFTSLNYSLKLQVLIPKIKF